MLTLIGLPAYTDFRLQQLQKKIELLLSTHCKTTPHLQLSAHYFYFIQARHEEELTEAEHLRLQALLQAKKWGASAMPVDPASFWIVPRVGTLSPWSSKASDILHRCAFSTIARIEQGVFFTCQQISEVFEPLDLLTVATALQDPLTESVLQSVDELERFFQNPTPTSFSTVPLLQEGPQALEKANQQWGLALSSLEIEALCKNFRTLQRDPTDVELMMFAQVNSEHCRHKIFNSRWNIDGQLQPHTLFEMIRHTDKINQQQAKTALVAYHDNAAVLRGKTARYFWVDAHSHEYGTHTERLGIVFKVETHNHPTAISPFPGAATGAGGEIRDEAATGRGAKTRAGLCGFSVSQLRIPGRPLPWELPESKPSTIASPLAIMLEAPLGAASFSNEFGRPTLCGYFRSFESLRSSASAAQQRLGFHKPIMIAGGIGEIREACLQKKPLHAGVPLIVLGGPGLPIGLGGGAASSRQNNSEQASLDFASVQRSNPEMQRRAQEVIDACSSLGPENPILSLHDVGAGGLSNAFPELVYANQLGATFALRTIPSDAPGMSPLEVWCNEAQERFVLAVDPEKLPVFKQLAEREGCPWAMVAHAQSVPQLKLQDTLFKNDPIDMPLSFLFEKLPLPTREDTAAAATATVLGNSKSDFESLSLAESIHRVLRSPTVGDKSFLITIGDRSVSGLVVREPMVGPWQVPVADAAVTTHGYEGFQGMAMAMGERPAVASIDPAISVRLAIAEALTNLLSVDIEQLSDIALSANWMAAAQTPGEGAALYRAVQTASTLCSALGITIPVGKDSLSMRAAWNDTESAKTVESPVTLIVSAAATVKDVSKTWTPQLRLSPEASALWLIDLSDQTYGCGASQLAEVYSLQGDSSADLASPACLKQFFELIKVLRQQALVWAYHDRSDGGLLVTLIEMMLASHRGLTVDLTAVTAPTHAFLFHEGPGSVVQIAKAHQELFLDLVAWAGLADRVFRVAEPNTQDVLHIQRGGETLYQEARVHLHRFWSETSFYLKALRDHPECAQQEYDNLLEVTDPGLNTHCNFTVSTGPFIAKGLAPRVAILREQGVNGHQEMAAAFVQAGFAAFDVHMNDLQSGRHDLAEFQGVVACGGFSFGDVLGAGRGWASRILYHEALRDAFGTFFNRADTFTLGVCNGCQMLAHLKTLIPGAAPWPLWVRNTSEQFEARFCTVKIEASPSLFFQGMQGSFIPVVVAHGEGRAQFAEAASAFALQKAHQVAVRFVDNHHQNTQRYPFNPSGTPEGITGVTSADGRVTLMMPHPERVFRTIQHTWQSLSVEGERAVWEEPSPWLQMFINAFHQFKI